MRSSALFDIWWIFVIISVAVGLAKSEQVIFPTVSASPEISVHAVETEKRSSDTADVLLDVDASTAHDKESGREARQFRTFGFGRPFGYGRPYGFGRPYYGGYGGFGRYRRPFYGGGFGRPYGYFPRPYYTRPFYGKPCCFYG